MIDVLIAGINGKMGAAVKRLLQDDPDARAVCGVDTAEERDTDIPVYKSFSYVRENVDVIIDFSSPSALESELLWATKKNIPVVLGTTGYDSKQLSLIDETAKKIALFKTANFSLGINLLIKLVRQAAKTLGENFDIEIIEKHHSHKADAPSGTALMLADSANVCEKEVLTGRKGKRGKEIGIHAVRGGTIVGEHEVIFAGEDEIVTLSHSARSKTVFAAGAVKAAKFLAGKPAGKYDMQDIL